MNLSDTCARVGSIAFDSDTSDGEREQLRNSTTDAESLADTDVSAPGLTASDLSTSGISEPDVVQMLTYEHELEFGTVDYLDDCIV